MIHFDIKKMRMLDVLIYFVLLNLIAQPIMTFITNEDIDVYCIYVTVYSKS